MEIGLSFWQGCKDRLDMGFIHMYGPHFHRYLFFNFLICKMLSLPSAEKDAVDMRYLIKNIQPILQHINREL